MQWPCTIDHVRINSDEGIRVGGPGLISISNTFVDTTALPGDHADGIQAYSPGDRGTIALTNVTFQSHAGDNSGMFTADNWTGTITMNNVAFIGDGGNYGRQIFPDTGGDNHISFNNVYIVGPWLFGQFNMKGVNGHSDIIDQWNNVYNATIVNGVLVPGSPIPCPSGNGVICPSGGGDTTPPSTPTNLSATAVSSSQINLSWTASTDNVGVTGYKIFRGGTQVGTSATNSYSNTGLSASTAYSYYVSAYDAAGNVSGNSNTASATTQAGTSVPTASLSANPTSITSGQSSTLTWSSTNATSCTGNGFTASGTSGSTSVSPTVTTTYSITCTGAGGTSPAASATVTVTTGGGGGGTYSIFATQVPTYSYTDGANTNYELGTKFQSTTAGQITAIRFYKASQESGTHTGHIWSSTGTLLATVTFSGETASGWQTQNLTTPLSIAANTIYTVSVNTAGTYYVATNGGLASAITNGPLSTIVGGNGTYGNPGVYPTNTWQTSIYYRDVVFTSGGGGADTTPPSVPAGLTASAVSSSQVNLSWTASTDNVGVTGYKIFRGGVQVGTSATASYSDTGLAASTVYSYTVSANDAAGNNSAQSSATGAITQRAGATSIAVGGRVVTTANLNVRQSASASATKLGTESIGALGTVIGGPTSANGYTWWQINYDNGISGWSISTYLLAAAATASPAVGMATPTQGSLSLIQQLMQQARALSLQLQTLQSQMAGAGAAVGN